LGFGAARECDTGEVFGEVTGRPPKGHLPVLVFAYSCVEILRAAITPSEDDKFGGRPNPFRTTNHSSFLAGQSQEDAVIYGDGTRQKSGRCGAGNSNSSGRTGNGRAGRLALQRIGVAGHDGKTGGGGSAGSGDAEAGVANKNLTEAAVGRGGLGLR